MAGHVSGLCIMAINPSTETLFGGNVTAPDANYPYGSGKNETIAGALDGTPFIKKMLDDIWGLQQSLLTAAGIVPDGNADTVLASQYKQAIDRLTVGKYDATYPYQVGEQARGSDNNIYTCINAGTGIDPVGDVTNVWRLSSANTNWTYQSNNFSAVSGGRYMFRNARTVTFPPNPENGDTIIIADRNGNWASNPSTVDGNGRDVNGSASYSLDTNDAVVTFYFVNNATGWRISVGIPSPSSGGNYLSAPAGQLAIVLGQNAPIGTLKLSSATGLLSRTTYANLWSYAQGSGMLVSDGAWLGGDTGKFSDGDGSTTFRVPEMRGEFVRAWDDGRGVDSGRTLGSSQLDQFQGFAVRANYVDDNRGNGSFSAAVTTGFTDLSNLVDDGVNGTPRKGSETRGRNVAYLFCITTGGV